MSAKVERLVNLTIALLEARRPLPLREIRERTGYYQQEDGESARRMFERDKDELRQLGVPIRVEADPLTTELGYIIDRRAYEMPDVDLDRDEVAALAVALRMTGQADDRLALSKLAARSPDPLDADRTPRARLELSTAAVDAIADALVERRTVRFPYRTARGEESERTLDPYGVGLRRGSWYVVGHDHDRNDLRAFRLDRMVGPVRTVSGAGAFEVPTDLDIAGQIRGPSAGGVDVEMAIADRARWAAESRGGRATGATVRGWAVYRFEDADPWRLLPWVLGMGPDAEILQPAEIRQAVIEQLRGAAQ